MHKKQLLAVTLCWWLTVLSIKANHTENQARPPTIEELELKFRDPLYTQEILPNNFSDLIWLLRFSKNAQQPIAYCQSVFRLFSNLLKSSEWVNPKSLLTMLEEAPALLSTYFIPYRTQHILRNHQDILSMSIFERLQNCFSIMLYDSYMSNTIACKQDPEGFFDKLSSEIFQTAHEEISVQALRAVTLRFFDIALNKLVWDPREQVHCWESVKAIANKLFALADCNIIIDLEELDDLAWSLIHRFCYFIDVSNSDLSLEFFNTIKQEIATERLEIFDLQEQATFLESKRECLLRILLAAEAQKRLEAVELKKR